jgi:hypothetical protein
VWNQEPCRTISQAIALARPGDKIIVGPGRYGDLDGDGHFGEAGEESAPIGCDCVIDVDRAVSIESRDGQSVTILDAGGAVERAGSYRSPPRK